MTLLVAACSSSAFTGESGRSAKLPPNKGGTGTSPQENVEGHSVDQNGHGNSADSLPTVYVPVGGQKTLGIPGACPKIDSAIVGCSNGILTGKAVGATTISVGGTP